MKVGTTIVGALLRSPLHRLLSSTTLLARYKGRRTGREFSSPAQYVEVGEDVVILVGRPGEKVWWRNFRDGHPIELLIRGSWRPLTGRVVLGADQPEVVGPLLAAYIERFPRAARELGADDDARRHNAVIVCCS